MGFKVSTCQRKIRVPQTCTVPPNLPAYILRTDSAAISNFKLCTWNSLNHHRGMQLFGMHPSSTTDPIIEEISSRWSNYGISTKKLHPKNLDSLKHTATHIFPSFYIHTTVSTPSFFFAGKRGTLLSRRGYKAIMVQILKNSVSLSTTSLVAIRSQYP
jgi:hypothetical protein